MDDNVSAKVGALQHPRLGGMMVLVLLLLAGFLFMLILSEMKAYRYIGGGVPISNTITVSGEGEAFAVPNLATFSFSVIEEAQTVKAAQDEATRKMNIALELLKTKGIEDKDVKTTSYNVYPRYEYKRGAIAIPGGGTRELAGYEVSQSISVKVRDTEKAGEILADIGSVGVSNVSGLQFTIDDEDALQREARQQAIDDAKAKARDLSRDLGVSLIRVVNFNEAGAQPLYRSFDFAEMAIATDASGAAVPELPVGENRIVSNVTISYEIR